MAVKDLFAGQLEAVNIGLEMFRDDLKAQGVNVRQVRFSPPAGGDPAVLKALDYLARPDIAAKIEAANETVVQRILQSQPMLVGFDEAIRVIPGMKENMLLHAGPPIKYEDMCGAMRGAVTGALVFEGLDVLRLRARVMEENIPSCRVLEKNGFRREGVVKMGAWKEGRAHDLWLYGKLKGQN